MSKSKAPAVLAGQASIFSFFTKAGSQTPTASTPREKVPSSVNIEEAASPGTTASKACTPAQAPVESPGEDSSSLRHRKTQKGSKKRRIDDDGASAGEHVGRQPSNLRRSTRAVKQVYKEDEQSDSASESEESNSDASGLAMSPLQREKSKEDLKQARLKQSVINIEESLGNLQYDKDEAAPSNSEISGGTQTADTKAEKAKRSRASKKQDPPSKKSKATTKTAVKAAEDPFAVQMKRWKAKEERKVEKEFMQAVESVEQSNAEKEEDAWLAAVSSVQKSIDPSSADAMAVDGEEIAVPGSDAEGNAAGKESEEEDDGMNSYEKERQANIRRNNAFLMNLGISTLPAPEPARPKAKAKARRKSSPPPPSRGTRRSTRSSTGDGEMSGAAQKKMEEADALEEVELQEAIDGGIMEDSEEAETRARITALREEAHVILEEVAERKRAARRAYVESEKEEEEEEELNFDDSSVKRYTCQAVPIETPAADLSRGVSGLAPLECAGLTSSGGDQNGEHTSVDMKRIYSASFRPGGALVAGGGHGGYAGVFGVGRGGDEDGGCLMTWRAHGQWLGEVQFLSQQRDGSNLLLTASNDKSMILWDINSSAKQGRKAVPKKLSEVKSAFCLPCEIKDKKPQSQFKGEFHRGGLFSLHEVSQLWAEACLGGDAIPERRRKETREMKDKGEERGKRPLLWKRKEKRTRGSTQMGEWGDQMGGSIVTSGKDGDVVLSSVTPTSLAHTTTFEGVHGNHVIKCVRFRTTGGAQTAPSVLASCGNDFKICITDTRIAGASSCVKSWAAADSPLNFVQWSPSDENLLMGSSFDKDIRIWDIRSTDKPLHSLSGHHLVPGGGKIKGMHRACFFAGGRYVAATGERTELLSVYDASSGAAVSRGETDAKGAAVVCYEEEGKTVLAVASPGRIQIYTPLAP